MFCHSSSEHPIKASVPQCTEVCWGFSYFNDILQLVPQACAHVNDCTLTFTCKKEQQIETFDHVKHTFDTILSWCRRCQVMHQLCQGANFAHALHRNSLDIQFGGSCLKFQKEIEILGLYINKNLTHTGHSGSLQKKAANKLTTWTP